MSLLLAIIQLVNLHTICFDFSKFFPWEENKTIDFQNFFERAHHLKKLTLIGQSFASNVTFPSRLEELTLNFSETIPVLDLLGLKNLKKFTAGSTSFSADSGSK